MEIAKVLVRTVTRVFYDTEQVIVIDALVNHGAISAADLSVVMDEGKTNHKKVQKYCAKLREGGLVSVYVRSETREGAQKPTNREYYYIDYRRAVDCTKYRIHMLDEKIKAISKPTQEKKDYFCPRCNSQWTTMEVLDNVDMTRGFLCKRCNFPLKHRSSAEEDEPEADDTPAKFNKQFKPLLDLLQQIDSTTVPAVTGEEAVANAKPVPRDENINPAQKTEVVADEKLRPTAVKGLTSGPEKVEITISTEEENTAAEQARVAAHKAKIAASNELPVWATHSTVGGETAGSKTNGENISSSDAANGYETAEEKKTNTAELDAYFAALEEEQRRKAKEEEEEDDEDDDEFEDVMGTPAAVSSGDGGPDAKRVKLDVSAAPTPPLSSVPAASSAQPSGGEESDADEFEDAL
ncbi:hypothetical protein SLS57_007404 [Botryosphaeria dothidea]